MDAHSPTVCPSCHTGVLPDAYFCAHCGRKLKEPPPATSLTKQIAIYLVSILLPPFGLIWAVRYLRARDAAATKIGMAIIALTAVSLAVNVWLTIRLYNTYVDLLNPYSGLLN